MTELRIRKDGLLAIPNKIVDALGLWPEAKIRLRIEEDRLVIERVRGPDDPFEAAAKAPDLDAMDRIQEQQAEETQRARDRFEQLLKKPPKVRPEDNPDLWR